MVQLSLSGFSNADQRTFVIVAQAFKVLGCLPKLNVNDLRLLTVPLFVSTSGYRLLKLKLCILLIGIYKWMVKFNGILGILLAIARLISFDGWHDAVHAAQRFCIFQEIFCVLCICGLKCFDRLLVNTTFTLLLLSL